MISAANSFLILLVFILLLTGTSTYGQDAHVVDNKVWNKVYKMASSELKKLYDDPNMITRISEIKSTMHMTEHTTPTWSDHPEVELSQVTFDVEVMYNKIINRDKGEIGSYREVLRCVLGKHKSFKWNRLSLYRNDCQDCNNQNLVELKRGINKRFASNS